MARTDQSLQRSGSFAHTSRSFAGNITSYSEQLIFTSLIIISRVDAFEDIFTTAATYGTEG